MAFGSDRSANFVIAAKDAATKPIGNVGKAMGRLRGVAGTAFKTIAAGAIAAATAIAAFTALAIKGAMSEEKSIILTNAALRQRGFDLDALGPKVEAQVKAFERFGLEGENVRAGIEAGSRFFKNQENLLKANAVAANIAAVTDQDLASVMRILGKAVQGQTRGLKTLGIEVEEGAKLKDILAAADEKYAGIADELANSTSGKMLAAQEKFNGAMDEFGLKLLPLVQEGLTFLTEKALPVFQDLMADLGPIVGNLVDNFVRPLVDSFAELFSLFESSDGSFSILKAVLLPLEVALTAIKIVIDAIVAGMKFIGIGGGPKLQKLDKAAADAGYSGGPRATGTPTMGGGGGGGGSSYLQVQNNITFGRDATSSVNTQLGQTATAAGRTRVGKRRP
jgi:hypothetical protein